MERQWNKSDGLAMLLKLLVTSCNLNSPPPFPGSPLYEGVNPGRGGDLAMLLKLVVGYLIQLLLSTSPPLVPSPMQWQMRDQNGCKQQKDCNLAKSGMEGDMRLCPSIGNITQD